MRKSLEPLYENFIELQLDATTPIVFSPDDVIALAYNPNEDQTVIRVNGVDEPIVVTENTKAAYDRVKSLLIS